MTFAEAAMIMMSGGSTPPTPSGPPTFPNSLSYYNYESSTYDYSYNGTDYVYGDSRTIPKDSIVICYYKGWYDSNNKWNYWYKYRIWQLLISDIDTASEEVYGLLDVDNNKRYLFQFNDKGMR